jgi:hypothetical protein
MEEQFLADMIGEMKSMYRSELKLLLIEEELTARISARNAAFVEDILSGKRKIMDKPSFVPAEDAEDFVPDEKSDMGLLSSVRKWIQYARRYNPPNRIHFGFL